MKIQIKNYRSCRANEGDAYSCTLYLDGKRAALVQYQGMGGPTDFDFSVAGKGHGRYSGPVYEAFKAFCESQPQIVCEFIDSKTGKPCLLTPTMELVFDDALNVFIENKTWKRKCRTKVVFRYKDAPRGEFQVANGKPWTGNEDAWRTQIAKWATADGKELAEILNERFAA